jgi:hypothetical protein
MPKTIFQKEEVRTVTEISQNCNITVTIDEYSNKLRR